MARRKHAPPVARPTGKGRLIEMGKNILIVALACSAVFLAWQTPIASRLQEWMNEPSQTAEPVDRQQSEAVEPYLVAVRNSMGLYGVSYDETLVGRAFEQVSSLLGEGLSSAAPGEAISHRQWRILLESPGIYCALQGAPPLSALTAWMGEKGILTGDAQALLLAWDGSQVWLCWRDGNTYFRAGTQVAYEGHMDEILEEFNPNGAAFAYKMAQMNKTYETLDPYVLVSMTAPQPQIYTASAPDFVGDAEALEQLLQVMGFQTGGGSAYESAGELAINESGDRLRISPAGTVTFHAGEEIRYPVTSWGDAVTAQEAALTAWDLLNKIADPWKGEGTFILTKVEETKEGWTITFHNRLNGIPVLTGKDGWCAQFNVEGQGICDFTISVRTYTESGTASVVLGERLAAAALKALPDTGGRLVLCYSDTGTTAVIAGWVAEDTSS